MLRQTHINVATATTLAIMQPKNPTELVLGLCVSAIGGMLPDIDSKTSKTHKEVEKICLTSLAMIVACALADQYFNLSLMYRLSSNANGFTVLCGFMTMIGILLYGKEQPHRSFTHSLLFLLGTSVAVWLMYSPMLPYYAIGCASHIVIDIFNKKKEKLLYPCKKGFGFGLCASDKKANMILGIITGIITIIEVAILCNRFI